MPPRKGEEPAGGRSSPALPGLRVTKLEQALEGRWGYAAAVLGGVALSFAFPSADWAPLAWVALIPLLAAARASNARRGALLGLLFGLGFFGLLLYWFSIVGYVAWALGILMESFFVALFGAVWALTSRHFQGVPCIPIAAALWVACEYLRAHFPWGGFTWGQLAQSQHNLPWMLRSASLAGAWGTGLLIVAANCAVLLALKQLPESRAGAGRYALIAAALIALPVLIPSLSADGRPLRVAIVQGNVPRSFRGDVATEERIILASHVRLTKELAGEHPDLVVWPESSVGIDIRRDPSVARQVASAARAVGVPMIVGADLNAGPKHYKVTTLLISPRGKIADIYQKTHLVPFGEYVPARRFLDWIPLLDQIPEDAIPAPRGKLFSVAGNRIAPVLSFEGDFGSLVRGRIAAGGRLLVVATNTSTWGTTSASAQHVAESQVRAAENGVWVVHAALSGVSAFIAPDGTVMRSTPLWKATSIVDTVRMRSMTTLYTRTGDWLPLLCLAISAVGLAASLLQDRTRAG